jgi:TRAP-type C4-dicarboxylate transport system permease small subunit
VLAVALIFSVCLNFANVIGRYAFGRSILGADEIAIYIVVWMTFLGAAVVAWRNQHLRMDVLVQAFPRLARLLLQACELALLITLAAFVLLQSSLYVAKMQQLGRTSDMAGVPMWIPHASIAAGFALMLVFTLLRAVEAYLKWRSSSDPAKAGEDCSTGAPP